MEHRTAHLLLFASAIMPSLLACSLGPRGASVGEEVSPDDEPPTTQQRVSSEAPRTGPVNVDEVEPPPAATGDDAGQGVIDCGGSASWPAEWSRAEAEVVRLINIERARGADCGSAGVFPAVPAVTSQANLARSARCHSLDMAAQDFFSHEGQGGSKFWERASGAGYTGAPVGENISAGQDTAAAAVASWMRSDGHCSNIMSASAREIGVGYVEDGALDDSGATGGGIDWPHLWTMVTGR